MTPSPEFQIQFLQGIQRILKEGSFSATYKFALLHAIADCCIEKGADDNSELLLTTLDLAEKFIEIYWSQASIFPNGKDSDILFQNKGRQAGIVNHIHNARKIDPNLSILKSTPHYSALSKEVSGVIQKMPLWKLQVLGDSVYDFLYPQIEKGRNVLLRPGIAYCFRQFYGQVTAMLQNAWISWIQKSSNNQDILGQNVNLEAFLFESKRSSLKAFVPILKQEQGNRCFYCEKEIRGDPEVDHFIPWSKYSVDLGHNFVLAHKACNSDKRDFLAAEEYYDKWNFRNESSGDDLGKQFDESRLQHDLLTSVAVADWAYRQCKLNHSQVWLGYKAGYSAL